jgi:hypothetical protein
MKPEEIAIAAGALGAAILDVLISKNVLTRQEAAKVTSDAMNIVLSFKGHATNGDATLILSRLGQNIAKS